MARPDLRASVAADVERTVTAQFPDVEVVSTQIVAGGVLRVLIDRPGGVDHDLCSRVTQVLRPYLDRYTLEVSSPGIPRPLLKPEHYERSVGREIAVKTSEPIEGRRTFTGTLREADAQRIVIEQDAVGVEIPLALVRKSHVVEEL